MKHALIITGLLAAVAVMAPMLVVTGYFFLIVPGLILTVAPTAFVYLVAIAVIRRLLPISSPVAATCAAFGIAVLVGWVVMQPFRSAAVADYEANRLPDVRPQQAIKLTGSVRLEMLDHRQEPLCDHLCLAVLDSPDVQSITVVTAGKGKQADQPRSDAFVLESAEANATAGIFPHEPGQIVREFPPLAQRFAGRKFIQATKAVEAEWALRLTQDERLRKVKPVAAENADWIIRIENQTNYRTSILRRLTILDSIGTVRFRKTYRKQSVPAHMLYFGFRVQGGAGTISSASFHLGKEELEDGDQSLDPENVLLSAIDFPIPRCDSGALVALREQVEQALSAPHATSVRLELARQFLGLFFFDATPQDHPLIANIVADDRVRNIDEQLKNVISKDATPLVMREAYAKRIVMEHTSASLRHWLAERLASLPSGTFSEPDESHVKIWTTAEIYRDAAPFIQSVSDLNPQQAMPILEAALTTALEIPTWQARRALIDGIREAMTRLGPHAASAAPRIRELFLRRPSPILHNANDADQWRFTLARMGLEDHEWPIFPNQSPEQAKRIHRRVADMLRRYEQDLAAKEKP